MMFNLAKVAVLLAATGSAFGAALSNRQSPPPLTTCTFVFVPDVPVDPTVTPVDPGFNYILGFYLTTVSSNPSYNAGSTSVESPDDVFTVTNSLGVYTWTAAQTATALAALVGQTKSSIGSSIVWTIESVKCDA
ncbi:hypothetical protein CVT24_012022 [Panaeolus cyanescens]|uniref:Uncharacterized protein n=1 Tax=Panaeolus cyanescens TaxID=181874 RepID=A0A409YP77_9AGAR|nr:hypothetical protein CVT24_012022 [Panaeolus cyanescens]